MAKFTWGTGEYGSATNKADMNVPFRGGSSPKPQSEPLTADIPMNQTPQSKNIGPLPGDDKIRSGRC